jgi:hypothetical protein
MISIVAALSMMRGRCSILLKRIRSMPHHFRTCKMFAMMLETMQNGRHDALENIPKG